MADKLKILLKELPVWSIDVISREEWYENDDNAILNYIQKQDDPTEALVMLVYICFVDIAKSLLNTHDGNILEAKENMKRGGYRRSLGKVLDVISGRKYQLSNQITLDDVNQITFLLLTNGLPNHAKKFYLFMMDELTNGKMITNGETNFSDDSLRYSAMAMTIFNDWLGLPKPDLEKLTLPKDPVWMHYAHHWREDNVEKFSVLLNQMCDVHLERVALNIKDIESGKYEFGSAYEALYPVEILGVLRLRELLGIQNPPLTHPLLLTPYAEITSFALEDELPEDPLLDDYLNALRKNDPELIEAWDNFVIQ